MVQELRDRELADDHDISQAHADALLKTGSAPKTSGGKDNENKSDAKGFYNPNGDAVNAAGLAGLETPAANNSAVPGASGSAGNLFSGTEAGKFASKIVGVLGINRRKGIAGILATIVVGGGIFGATITSGDFEFIHFAQTLHDQHFSQQDQASDTKMGRLIRAVRKGNVGETRLGYLSSKMYSSMLADLNGVGLEPYYTTGSLAKGFTVDSTNENSPTKGMTDEEVKTYYESKGFTVDLANKVNGKILVAPSSRAGDLQASKFLASQSSGGSAAKYLRARALNKYGFTPKNWHILKRVDEAQFKTQAAALDYFKQQLKDRFSGKADPQVADASSAKEDTGTKDAQGKPVSTDAVGDKISTTAGYKSTLSGLKSGGLKAGGALSAALAVACTAKAVDDKLPEIKYVQVIKPLMNLGVGLMSIGYQVMDGTDVSNVELAAAHELFNTISASGVSQNWSNNAVDQSAAGQPGGVDVTQENKDLISKGSPSWLAWTQTTPVKDACSTAGQYIAGAAGFIVTVFTGGTASFIGQALISAVALPHVVDAFANLLGGQGLDLASATGPMLRLYSHYGAQIGANTNSLAMAGTVVNGTQLSELNNLVAGDQSASWQSKSFVARLFDPQDQRSLLSHAMDAQNPSVAQNLNNMASGFLNIGTSLLRLPATLFTRTTSAGPQPYQYPFKTVATSVEDLNNPDVIDPYANGDNVAPLLDNNNQNGELDYIQKAKDCFGVNIAKTPDEDGVARWSAVSDPTAAQTAMTNFYAGNGSYDAAGCGAAGPNNDWLRIRSFIGDSGLMDSYACYHNVQQSCDNNGIGSTGATGTPSAAPASTGAYNNPLRGIKNVVPERIDGGVDYNGNDGPIYAIGDGVVTGVRTGSSSGWPGNPGAYILYQLSGGPASGKFVYMAEDCTPTVKAGDTLTSNSVICNYHYSGTAMEMGWGDGSYGYLTNDYSSHGGGSYASNSGQDFSKLMVSLHAPAGKVEGTQSTQPMPAGWPTW